MNHSIPVIIEFICDFYNIKESQLFSYESYENVLMARRMVCMFSNGRDKEIAEYLGRYRCQIPILRKTIKGYIEFNKEIRDEYEQIKKGLLMYEISEYYHAPDCKTLMHCVK